MTRFATVPEAMAALRAGSLIVLVDDEDRENEGDLVIAAEKITPAAITFMAKQASGLVCLPMAGALCDRLELDALTQDNRSKYGTNFTVSIEAAAGVTTGISSADRAHTIHSAIADDARADDIVRPGHVFPIRARDGGVLVRAGQTEGSVDLCRLAGLKPAAVICEIIKEDGTMARLGDLERFCAIHDLLLVSVASIIEFRRKRERLVERLESVPIPTARGSFRMHLYRSLVDGSEHTVFTMGVEDPPARLAGITASPMPEASSSDMAVQTENRIASEPALVRVHSQCLTGDVFGSLRCDCGAQLEKALDMIAAEGRGVVLYLGQEGRGIGLRGKLHAYRLQDEGQDTVDANLSQGFKADHREYGIGAQILFDLGVTKMRLITNNPTKRGGLEGFGLEIVERVPLVIPATDDNRRYLDTKRERLGHHLPESK